MIGKMQRDCVHAILASINFRYSFLNSLGSLVNSEEKNFTISELKCYLKEGQTILAQSNQSTKARGKNTRNLNESLRRTERIN